MSALGIMDPMREVPFSSLDLEDPFFGSLRDSYDDFERWFRRKSEAGERTLVVRDTQGGKLIAMLYLKREDGIEPEVVPELAGPRLKIGTFKVNLDHHTSLGKRLLAVALRRFAKSGLPRVYVTMHDNDGTKGLRKLLRQYGFRRVGMKREEEVWEKTRPFGERSDPYESFPFLTPTDRRHYILAIRPEYHQRMFVERLRTERNVPIEDEICTNTLEKLYLSAASNASSLMPGDRIAIYRTSPKGRSAEFALVISSICTVTEVRDIRSFRSREEFFSFIKGRSVFTDAELERFWNQKRYPYIICMLYNFPLKRHPIRKVLIEEGVIDRSTRLVCEPIDGGRFERILTLGGADEGYVVD